VKSLEKRIQRLERAWQPGLKTGVYWPEVVFVTKFRQKWPNRDTAPKFALAAYDEIMQRFDPRPAGARTAHSSDTSTESPND